MNKEEFLRRLEQLLGDISGEERADAMAFYRSYFEEAGADNESRVLRELESPEKVAENIKKNLGGQGRKTDTAGVALTVVLLVFTSPVWIGAAAALLGIAVAVIIAMVMLVLAGIGLAGMGIGILATAHPVVGIALLGGGLLLVAFGILLAIAAVWLIGGFFPWLAKKIAKLWRRLFHRGEERAAV